VKTIPVQVIYGRASSDLDFMVSSLGTERYRLTKFCRKQKVAQSGAKSYQRQILINFADMGACDINSSDSLLGCLLQQ